MTSMYFLPSDLLQCTERARGGGLPDVNRDSGRSLALSIPRLLEISRTPQSFFCVARVPLRLTTRQLLS